MKANFSTVGKGIMTLFEMTTTEGWIGVMFSTMDVREED